MKKDIDGSYEEHLEDLSDWYWEYGCSLFGNLDQDQLKKASQDQRGSPKEITDIPEDTAKKGKLSLFNKGTA